MDTAATAANPHEAAAHDAPPAVSHDPTRDIDGKSTVFWLVLCTVVFFASFYFLYMFFNFAIQNERETKVEQSPTPQLDELRSWEESELSGGEGRVSIEEAMKRLAEKKKGS